VPSLIARLNDDKQVVVLRAIGALVAIGDRRAVRPLIELTRKRPPQIVSQILYALGSLGGPEAESFLYTLESGAAEEEVRRAAAEAFADLRRKQTEAAHRTVVP
jgi:HEAT repeat protein